MGQKAQGISCYFARCLLRKANKFERLEHSFPADSGGGTGSKIGDSPDGARIRTCSEIVTNWAVGEFFFAIS
jgi:hypothetical protein